MPNPIVCPTDEVERLVSGRLRVVSPLYRALGLFLMTVTLLAALGTPFDPSLWLCAPAGYAAAMLMVWFDRNPLPNIDTPEAQPSGRTTREERDRG